MLPDIVPLPIPSPLSVPDPVLRNYDSRYDPGRNAFKDDIWLDHVESRQEKYWLDWLDKKPFTILFCDGIVKPSEYTSEKALRQALRRMDDFGMLYRVDHISWWEKELPSEDEMARGLNELAKHGNKVDYILSHCGPQQVVSVIDFTESDKLTEYFDKVAEMTEFKRWFFGHYHENRQIMTKYIALYEQIVRIW